MDSIKRCNWVNLKNNLYIDYHDNEWGNPKHDDLELFELLILELFQAGLSWECILNKRKYFKNAFDNFDYVKISSYGEDKVNELLGNSNIVRNKRKIVATIINAKVFIDIQKEYGSFNNYIWHFTDNKVINSHNSSITHTHLSDEISKDLKERGMKFVGTIIIYSYLQAIGIVNDHDKDCFKNKN